MANLLLGNEQFCTFHNKCSKISPPTSLHFATRVRKSYVFLLSLSSRFFVRAVETKIRVSNSSRLSIFVFIQPHKQNCNRLRPGDSNSFLSVTIPNYTHVHMSCFCHGDPCYQLLNCLSFSLNHLLCEIILIRFESQYMSLELM